MEKIYFKNLDALRFLSFLSVFFFHSFHTESSALKAETTYVYVNEFFKNGNLGVNFFFVLSGFLITYFLLIEKTKNHSINIKNFWLRRVLRIWPLFYVAVFIGFIIFPVLKEFFGQQPNETANIYYYISFLNNFDLIKNGLPDASILGVLWSIAIEEQFYFIWPVVLSLFSVKRFWIPFFAIVLLSLFFRFQNPYYMYHEFHTLSCINDMAVGSLGAWLVLTHDKFLLKIKNLSKLNIKIIYLLLFIIFFFRNSIINLNLITLVSERLFIAVVFILVILEQNYCKNSMFKLKNLKIMSVLGKYTYGMYVLHFIGILIAINITKLLHINDSLWTVLVLETVLALSITVTLSIISYKYFEKPFLKIKDKFN